MSLSLSSGPIAAGPVGAGPVAVIAVETTGLFPLRGDRVVEVAVVVVCADGRVEREFSSLVNPGRDIGSSSLHGLTSADILHAPQFSGIAAALLETLSETVAIAGHNVPFDRQFLESEFARLQCELPDCFTVSTMQLAGGGRLAECCRDYGIVLEGASHQALADARATVQLLTCLLPDAPRTVQKLKKLAPIQWPVISIAKKSTVTRAESRRRRLELPTYLQRLLARRRDHALPAATDSAVLAYGALLDRCLEDRHVNDAEADALVETAVKWGLAVDQIALAHRDYLNQLTVAAVADGVVTDAVRRDLQLVARLLGQGTRDLNEILREATTKVAESHRAQASAPAAAAGLSGMSVCFTGELKSERGGQRISPELADELATQAGLFVQDAVTKRLDILVLADPHSQSGKAKKARLYNIRTLQESEFWKAIGVQVD